MAPQSPALGGLAQRLGPTRAQRGRNKKAKPQGGQSCSPRSCSVRLKPKMVQSANASKNEFFIYKRKYIYVEYWNNWSSSIMVNWDSYWYGCYHIGRNFFLWFLCWFRIITLNRAPFGAQQRLRRRRSPNQSSYPHRPQRQQASKIISLTS